MPLTLPGAAEDTADSLTACSLNLFDLSPSFSDFFNDSTFAAAGGMLDCTALICGLGLDSSNFRVVNEFLEPKWLRVSQTWMPKTNLVSKHGGVVEDFPFPGAIFSFVLVYTGFIPMPYTLPEPQTVSCRLVWLFTDGQGF